MSNFARIFAYQSLHVACLAVLLGGVGVLSRLPGFGNGGWLGVATPAWVAWCLAGAVAHQGFVWFCWRTELHGRLLTRRLGRAAFPAYVAVFTVLLVSRPLLITGLAVANAGTIPEGAASALRVLGVSLLVPVGYLAYSVARFFGFLRACGSDHFCAAGGAAAEQGLVRRGMFRYTDNAMYAVGFLALWIPGLVCGSLAALVVAAFSHAYIWVHYYCTERPDLRAIYGPG